MSNRSLSDLVPRISRGLGRFLPTRPRLVQSSQPMISFTFDDVPDSAFLNGARLLEEQGLRGTFYIAPGICGSHDTHWRVITRDQVAELSRRGHEIGCHTYGHVPVQSLSIAELGKDDQRCRDALKLICGDVPLKSFAFPYGNVGFPAKWKMQSLYETCRGIRLGTNRGLVDFSMLCVRELYDSVLDPAGIDQLLDGLMRRGGWLVFYTHDVTDQPSQIGCTPKLLDYAIKAAISRGIACPPVSSATTFRLHY